MVRRLVAVLTVAVATCVAVAPRETVAASETTVRLRDIAFKPATVRIRRGQIPTWRFVDQQVSHNVRSRGKHRFRSSETKLTGRHTARFRRAGTYRYVCTIHPGMAGRVVVR